MFPPKTPGEIEAEILMSRQVHRGSFLLVEGPDDSKFWRGRIIKGDCEIVIAMGKPNLVGAIERLDMRQFVGILGIIDDDFDCLEQRRYNSDNLISTDAHDLECLLLYSPALESVLGELGDQAKIMRFEQHAGVSVKDALLNNGLVFGRLRWLALRQDWCLGVGVHTPLNPARFIDSETWAVKEPEIMDATAQTLNLNVEDLRGLLDDLPSANPPHVCQGHDLTEILRIGLQKVLGNLKTTYTKDDIASSLRLAFHDTHFAATQLYADIKNWERLNIPYQILPSQV